MFYIEGIFN